jgi:hypothetical protein
MLFSNNGFFTAWVSLGGLVTVALTDCTREMLTDATDRFVAAQAAGSLSNITALSESTPYTENEKTVSIKSGILSKALKIDNSKSTHDTTACSTYTELIVADDKNPYVIGTQMHFTGSQISKVDTILTTTGDWLFNAKNTLSWAQKESWTVIPESKRDTRAVIQAAADAYCDVFKNKNVTVPWGTPCDRLEGGSYTGKLSY